MRPAGHDLLRQGNEQRKGWARDRGTGSLFCLVCFTSVRNFGGEGEGSVIRVCSASGWADPPRHPEGGGRGLQALKIYRARLGWHARLRLAI